MNTRAKEGKRTRRKGKRGNMSWEEEGEDGSWRNRRRTMGEEERG